MTWFKKSFYVLTMIAIATMVSGCSKKNVATTTSKEIVIWSFEDEDIWKPVFENISQGEDTSLKQYTIKYVKKNLSSRYENDSLNSIMSNKGPDVWAIPNDWVRRHKDKLSILDAASKISFESLAPAIKESTYIDDHIYGFGNYIDPLVLYYNPSLIEEFVKEYSSNNPAPEIKHNESDEDYENRQDVIERKQELIFRSSVPNNWEDLLKWVEKYTKKDGDKITRSAIALGHTSNVTFSNEITYNLMMQNSVKMTNEEGTLATFNLPSTNAAGQQVFPGKYAFELFKKFSDRSSPAYTWNADFNKDYEAFAQGQTAMFIAPNSFGNKVSNLNPTMKFKKTYLPHVKNDDSSKIYYGRFITLVVPKYSLNAVSAAKIAAMGGSTLYGIVNAKSLDEETLRDYQSQDDISTYVAQIISKDTHTWSKGRYPDEVNMLFNSAMEGFLSGKQDSQGALDSVATKVTELLKKEDW